MLYPIMMTLRGNICGIFSARLSTGLNLGIIRPSFRKNTPLFMILFSAINSVSFLLSFFSGLMVFFAQMITEGFKPWLLIVILLTALGVQIISISISIPIACTMGFVSFKRNIDPDVVFYPIMSTVTDIVESFTYIIVIIMVKSLLGVITLSFLCILYFLVILFFVKRYGKEEEFIKSISQAFASLLISLSFGWLSGLALSNVRFKLEKYPSIIIIYPAIIDTLGDFGASLGSIFTTRLFEGSINPRLSLSLLEFYETIQMWLSALIYFVVYASIASANGFQGVHAIILCFIASSPIILFICRLSAVEVFKRNLDPDNFVIPFETTLSDFLGTVLLSLFLGLI